MLDFVFGRLMIAIKLLFYRQLGMSTQLIIRQYMGAWHRLQGGALTRRSASSRAHHA